MIRLRFVDIEHTRLKEGNIIHLKIKAMKSKGPGRWELWVDDVTPLPGADPPGYACHLCGIVEPAKENGFPLDGWVNKKFPERSFFICKECNEGIHEPLFGLCRYEDRKGGLIMKQNFRCYKCHGFVSAECERYPAKQGYLKGICPKCKSENLIYKPWTYKTMYGTGTLCRGKER